MDKESKIKKLYVLSKVCLALLVIMVLGMYLVLVIARKKVSEDEWWSGFYMCLVGTVLVIAFVYLWKFLDHRANVAIRFFNFYEGFYENFNDIYLCGFHYSSYIKSLAFYRLAGYCGTSICHEIAIMSMFALKEYNTAVLCHGIRPGEGNPYSRMHSWVEFYVPKLGWYVFDPAWTTGFCTRSLYYRKVAKKMQIKKMTYDTFWEIGLVNEICSRMENMNTSYVLDILTVFVPDTNLEFNKIVYELHVRPEEYCTGNAMHPIEIGDKVIWANVMREFVKNPDRKQPRARAIRVANHVKKEFAKINKE